MMNRYYSFIIPAVVCILAASGFCFPDDTSKKSIYVSLDEISKLALENNLDIQIAKYDVYISRYGLDKANSIFDTFLTAKAGYSNDQPASSTVFSGNKELENTYSLSLEKKFPTGTKVTLEGSHTRTWSDSSFVSINPAAEAETKVSLSQSLGKNFFGLRDRLEVKLAQLDIAHSRYLSLDDIEKSLADVQKAYWNVVLKKRELEIKKDMRKEAEKLYLRHKENYSLGLVEEPDLLASEAYLKQRENDVLIAELMLKTAENDLLFLLNRPESEVSIIPRDNLDFSLREEDLYAVLNTAINNRRDYKALSNEALQKDISVRIDKNSLWPEIDLEASLARNGVSKKAGQAWSNVTSEDNPVLFLGLTVKVPLENREAKSGYNISLAEKEKVLLKLKKVERLILRDVNNQVSAVNTLKRKAEASKEILALQKEKLEAEGKRFKYGRSSSDLIIRYEEDFLNARLSLANDLYNYKISRIDLDLAENSLLNRYWKGKL